MAKDLYIPVTLRGNRLEAKAQLGQTVIVTEGPEKYTPAPITPTEEQQTIPTKDKQLTADVIVEPIPSEYIIPTGTEEITVTENGTVSMDVSAKETVTVNTNVPIPPGYIIPTGNLGITENGQYDVTEKASVTVDVPAPVPTGTIEITENGTYDVVDMATALVNVSAPQNVVTGSFVGDGTLSKTINCPFEPDLVYVYAPGKFDGYAGTGMWFLFVSDVAAVTLRKTTQGAMDTAAGYIQPTTDNKPGFSYTGGIVTINAPNSNYYKFAPVTYNYMLIKLSQ